MATIQLETNFRLRVRLQFCGLLVGTDIKTKFGGMIAPEQPMIEYAVYSDGVISVALFAENSDQAERNLLHLAVRWLSPQPIRGKHGEIVLTTNVMGGQTEWFTLPFSFGSAVGKKLVEQKVAGLSGFHEDGFAKMVAWLVELEVLADAMCY